MLSFDLNKFRSFMSVRNVGPATVSQVCKNGLKVVGGLVVLAGVGMKTEALTTAQKLEDYASSSLPEMARTAVTSVLKFGVLPVSCLTLGFSCAMIILGVGQMTQKQPRRLLGAAIITTAVCLNLGAYACLRWASE